MNKQSTKLIEISIDNFNKFTKVTKENIDKLFQSGYLFIFLKELKSKAIIEHEFYVRKQFKLGLNEFYFIKDDSISLYRFRCFKNEKNDEFNEDLNLIKEVVVNQLKKDNVYALKIN